ncbi:MAG: DUF421 domain-containing protein [Flavisolibacter sp.]
MNPEDIKLSDWQRILVGEAPPSFYIELVIRALIVFVLLCVSMRLLGRRMAAQLNRIEMIALFSLAAAIGVPLQAPDRGILPAFVIALVVVLIGRMVAKISFRSQRFESIAEDDYAMLIKDGELQMENMKETRLTVQRLFAQLRSEGIRHLGEVERLYFEANGSFSLVRSRQPRPGLAVIPLHDEEWLGEQKFAPVKVCESCGHQQTDQKNRHMECEKCGNKKWVSAIE